MKEKHSSAEIDTYKKKIIYDHESNECLYQMDKNESVLYQYFNKKDTDSDSYKMYVNTSVDNQKLKYKSNEECINHFMNLYENPIRYTDYGDVLIDVGGFTALEQLNYIVDLSNSGQPAFLKQASYQDGLEYFKEYFTLIFSEAIQSSSKLNDLSSTFAYEKTNSVTSIKYSGASSTTFEGIDGFDETIIDLKINYIFELDNKSRFTSITRTTSFSNCNFKDGQEIEEGSYNFNLTNVETFEYDIGDWTLNEDATGYTDTNTYPLYSLDIQLFQTCDGLPFSSSGSLTNFVGDGNIDFNYLDDVVDIIPNQYETEYRKEGTKIEKVYLDPECTKEFTGTNMKIGKLSLYCTYDYLDDVCIATERYITDISAYGYKFGSEILFDDRLAYSSEYNFIDFIGRKEIKFDESDFEIHPNPIGDFTLQSVTIDDVTYDKEALLEGITYDLNNGTVITKNYGLVNQ